MYILVSLCIYNKCNTLHYIEGFLGGYAVIRITGKILHTSDSMLTHAWSPALLASWGGFFSRALLLLCTSHDRRSSVGVADENFEISAEMTIKICTEVT